MKQFALLVALVFSSLWMNAQDKVFTRSGSVTFTSETPIETIEGAHKKAACAVDLASGKVQVSILVKGFAFEKALMEEHFNENYMESSKFPKATFKGAIDDFDASKFKGDDNFTTMPIEGSIMVRSNFVVKPADHDIKIPGVVTDNIAKELNVKLVSKLESVK